MVRPHPLVALLLSSSLATLASAHFSLIAPVPLGDTDDEQGTSPCGGFVANLDDAASVHDFHAGGDPVLVRTSHPQANWLVRGTLDGSAAGGWEELGPIFQQSGAGTFCIPAVSVPADWVGQRGIVGIVSNGVDGMLYACSAANFIQGTGEVTSSCTNGSIEISAVADDQLSAQLGTPSETPSDGDDHDHDDEGGASLPLPGAPGFVFIAMAATGAVFVL